MRRRPRSGQEGFGLFIVVMIVALVSVAGMSLMDVIRVDLLLVGNERQTMIAREVAEGALMEMINDEQTPTMLPMLDDPDLEADYVPSAQTPFVDAIGLREFQATARFLRVVPLAESSHTYSRAVVHEVSVQSSVGSGDATHDVRAEIYRTVTFRPGVVLPRRHAR